MDEIWANVHFCVCMCVCERVILWEKKTACVPKNFQENVNIQITRGLL